MCCVQLFIMKFELHYAEMNLQGDIPCFKFDEQHELINEILGFGKSKSMMQKMRSAKEVYLCAIENYPQDYDGVVLIDNKPEQIIEFIRQNTMTPTMKLIFLQVYPSYEVAYRVALDMKEVSPLCYS